MDRLEQLISQSGHLRVQCGLQGRLPAPAALPRTRLLGHGERRRGDNDGEQRGRTPEAGQRRGAEAERLHQHQRQSGQWEHHGNRVLSQRRSVGASDGH